MLEVLGIAFLIVVVFGGGIALGRFAQGFRGPLVVIIGVPAAYFAGNLVVAMARQGLQESLLVGIPLGHSPALLLLLTLASASVFLGVAAGAWWPSVRRFGSGWE